MRWLCQLSILVLLLLPTACGAPEPSSAPPPAAEAAPQAAPAAPQAKVAADTAAEAVADDVAGDVAAEAGDEDQVAEAAEVNPAAEEPPATVADIGPAPAFSPDLKATDPTSVALGAGQPQLVEFFAFW